MSSKALLLSIKPEFAKKIQAGLKTVELRRTEPKVQPGDLALIYASSPVKALVGAFKVDEVTERPLKDLWTEVKNRAGISRAQFYAYFEGVSIGYGIYFSDVWFLADPVTLPELQSIWPGFQAPQSYRYIATPELAKDQFDGCFI